MLLEEATGVNLNWTLIDQDSYGEQFSIMLATGDYPDYLGAADTQVSGGIGEVVFTDLITNNPNGFPAMFNSCSEIVFFDFPFVNSMERKAATLSNEAEVEAQTIWRTNTSDEMRYFGSLTAEESQEYAAKIGDIATASAENVSKFVLGVRPMSEWDSFLDDLRSMKIDDCIALKQAAYDRYQAR